jgi:hypothetical protein
VERNQFVAIVSPLVIGMQSKFDQTTWTVWYRALGDVPEALLQAAVDRALKSSSPFMVKPGELRKLAEEARQALTTAHPFECLCGNCSRQGFVEREIDGVKRMVRGSCWRIHQESLKELGVGAEPLTPLALPPATDPEAA